MAAVGFGVADPAGSGEWQCASRRLGPCSLDVPREAPSNGFLMGPRRKTDGLTEGMLNISCSNCYIRALTSLKRGLNERFRGSLLEAISHTRRRTRWLLFLREEAQTGAQGRRESAAGFSQSCDGLFT